MVDTSKLSAQQMSFRATVIKDLMEAYRRRGCCSAVIEWEEKYQEMTYPELVGYWQKAFPKKKVPVGSEP